MRTLKIRCISIPKYIKSSAHIIAQWCLLVWIPHVDGLHIGNTDSLTALNCMNKKI